MAGGNFGGGTGVENDPYLVEDLSDFLQAVGTDSVSKYYKQVLDISGGSVGSSIRDWEGSYDGDYHIIENVGLLNEGFFSSGIRGTVKNMTIKNCHISGDSEDGSGIIGNWLHGGFVSGIICEDCSVSGAGYVGGILGGVDYDGGDIQSCYFAGDVSAGSEWVAGGIVGHANPKTGKTVGIGGCGFVGNVTGGGLVGGIIGNLSNSRVSVGTSYARGAISSGYDAGGISGDIVYDISQCYFAGNIGIGEYGEGDGIAPYGSSASSYSNSPTNSNYRSTTDMQYPYNESTTYVGWDFDNVWAIDATNNDKFPYHLWKAQRDITGFNIWARKNDKWHGPPDSSVLVWANKGDKWNPIEEVFVKKGSVWVIV